MTKKRNIAFLPLDNRPISYLLPKSIAEYSGINLLLPDRSKLGGLKTDSDTTYLQDWIINLNTDAYVLALDNWIYGGLVSSRLHNNSIDYLKNRVKFLKENILGSIYGFSSIMRIPNYNSDEEEKSYWNEYGEKIFKWSELMHRVSKGITLEDENHEDLIEKWYASSQDIPAEIIADFKAHRDKNLEINLEWVHLLSEDRLKYLLFSCDDSGEYGLNLIEADYIKKEINKYHCSSKSLVLSGTDEMPLLLLTKSTIDFYKTCPKVSVIFSDDFGKNETARYESSSIFMSVVNQLSTLGITLSESNDADLVLCVHVASGKQGDHVFKVNPKDTKSHAANFIGKIANLNKPYILVDLAYANGADPNLIEPLIKNKIDLKNFYGYAGWNTCSNSLGTAISMGVNRWIAEKENSFCMESFKKSMLIRLLDDYAYQAVIRKKDIMALELNTLIRPFVQDISSALELNDINVNCKLPWSRSFEIEIEII